MSDPLVRTSIPEGWIDLGIGDARAVRRALEEIFGFGFDMFSGIEREALFDYQPPHGLPQLVSYLEHKHKGAVIVTAGAKQGLCAAFHALKLKDRTRLGMRVPYWSQMPHAVESEGVIPVLRGGEFDSLQIDAYLAVSPSNPDSYIEDPDYVNRLKDAGTIVIHDGAYNTRAYVPDDRSRQLESDIEIYSCSKMFGLSGLRVGYCVVRNRDLYKPMLDYVETKTVGVSSLSQNFVLSLFKRGDQLVDDGRTLMNVFEDRVQTELRACANEFSRITELNDFACHKLPGPMFGWFYNDGVDFEKHKVRVLDGKYFGAPGYVRINFAAGLEVCTESVDRLLTE